MSKPDKVSISDLCDIVQAARFLEDNFDLSSPAALFTSMEDYLKLSITKADKIHDLRKQLNKLVVAAENLGATPVSAIQIKKGGQG